MDVRSSSAERAARRASILQAAVEVFAAQGFVNARTREIARRAGIGEGTIYLYFEGKDDLLLTAFREKVSEFCEAVHHLLSEPGTFDERLRRFIWMQFAGIEADPELATVLLLESRQSTRFYGEPVREVLREYASAVDRLLESGVAEGRVRTDLEIPLVRRMLIGSLEEIELDWLVGQRGRPLTTSAPDVAKVFLEGIQVGRDG